MRRLGSRGGVKVCMWLGGGGGMLGSKVRHDGWSFGGGVCAVACCRLLHAVMCY